VPEQLSVLGFDDVEAAEYTGLTTIAQPLEESGALGAELLLRRMSGEAVEPRELPLALVDRGSTAPFRCRIASEGNQWKHELKSGIRRRRVHA
jgi:DNA-binding LacI/PurR family transcriptional regulator